MKTTKVRSAILTLEEVLLLELAAKEAVLMGDIREAKDIEAKIRMLKATISTETLLDGLKEVV